VIGKGNGKLGPRAMDLSFEGIESGGLGFRSRSSEVYYQDDVDDRDF
jgi:hypothetical protein